MEQSRSVDPAHHHQRSSSRIEEEAILKNDERTEHYTSMICARDFTVYENSEIRKKVVTGGLRQCGAAKECGTCTPPQENQQPHGVERWVSIIKTCFCSGLYGI